MITFYGIRDKKGGRFSTGGECPTWGKKGKTWWRLCDVRAHLAKLTTQGWDRYINAEVVTYEATETASQDVSSIQDEIREAKAAHAARMLASAARSAAKRADLIRNEIEAREQAELRRLKAKYPGM